MCELQHSGSIRLWRLIILDEGLLRLENAIKLFYFYRRNIILSVFTREFQQKASGNSKKTKTFWKLKANPQENTQPTFMQNADAKLQSISDLYRPPTPQTPKVLKKGDLTPPPNPRKIKFLLRAILH